AMAYPSSVKLGAPGVYPYQPAPPRALAGVRMDVCAFAGVAPRGPARVPTFDETWRDDRPCVEPERPRSRTVAAAVESFDEYRRLYGGFEGPGLLPYARLLLRAGRSSRIRRARRTRLRRPRRRRRRSRLRRRARRAHDRGPLAS